MASKFPKTYKLFVYCNTMTFHLSLSVILLLLDRMSRCQTVFGKVPTRMATMFVGLLFAMPVVIMNNDTKKSPMYPKAGIVVFVQVIEGSHDTSGSAINVAAVYENVSVEASGSNVPHEVRPP
ncbi:hypothetical protein EUGRSUZ_G00332 [Eucalyptus grandis]|uniref:PGG domain-containing protein n=2 Tax=Eucalyptus grandis TaxID=71139 RepID=A0A059BA05_EUCGR|nr:hypothetical protein EUGRSUZ_G00332 [Eucalyptus grandis]